jgi:hypothetical protein
MSIALRIEKSFGISIGFHVLFLMSVFIMNTLSEKPKVFNTPIEIVALEEARPVIHSSAVASAAPAMSVRGVSKGFGGLLANAARGMSKSVVSGVQKQVVSSDLSASSKNLKKGLLASVLAQATQGAKVATPNSQTNVRWDLLATSGGTTTSVADREEIRKIISAHEGAFRLCHEKSLLVDAALSGSADLLFSVVSGGRVANITVAYQGTGSTVGRNIFKACVQSEAGRIVFPASIKGSQVRFTLVLR